MRNFLTFIENSTYPLASLEEYNFCIDELPPEYYHMTKNHITFTCVGLILSREVNLIIFPKEYKIPTDSKNLLSETNILLKTIRKYNRKRRKEHVLSSNTLNNSSINDNYIGSMTKIIEYYLEHGLIYKNNMTYKRNSTQRINWSKTIKNTIPLFIGNSAYYLDTISSVKNKDYNSLLSTLNKIALYISFSQIGFLYETFLDSSDKEYSILLSEFIHNKKKFEYILERAIEETFNADKLELLLSIKTVLFGYEQSTNSTNTIPFVTIDFEDIWQDVVSECFDDKLNLYSDSFPSLSVEFNGCLESHPQIPDTLVKLDDDNWMILDAKYYSVDYKRPGKGDYLKQYFYEFSFNQPYKHIDNALIFNYYGDPICYLGKAQISNTLNDFINNRVIYLIGINQAFAYKTYVYGSYKSSYFQNELKSIINKNRAREL